MNSFEEKLRESGHYPLRAKAIKSVVLGMGDECNLRCTHCYVDASPEKRGLTPLSTIEKVLGILVDHPGITAVNVTGGAPELNPHFRYFVRSAAMMGRDVVVSSNLTLFSEAGLRDIPEFLADTKVTVLGSLPGLTEDIVERQRGRGTYAKVISSLKRLNELGYGKEGSGLELDIIHNPAKTSLAPLLQILEKDYREKLMEEHGISFNHLYTMNNMPVGRMRKLMSEIEVMVYMKELEARFNPETIENLMCRSCITFGRSGENYYDCDFKRVQQLPIKGEGLSPGIFDYDRLGGREIATTRFCLVCTAAAGQQCCAAKLS